MIQGLKKTIFITMWSSQKRLKCDSRILRYGTENKVDFILWCTLATRNEINITTCHCQFVPNSLIYVSAKYYLNWFRVGKVIANIKRWTFLRHCVEYRDVVKCLLVLRYCLSLETKLESLLLTLVSNYCSSNWLCALNK